MPHLTLEYTDNLNFDVQDVLKRLHSELIATGAINLKGLKSRAVRQSEYRIADGNPEYAFVHVNLLIREGRPIEVQKDLAQRVMKVLEDTLGQRFENNYLSISVDIKEMREGIAAQFGLQHFARPGGREASFFDLHDVRQRLDGRRLDGPLTNLHAPSRFPPLPFPRVASVPPD